MESENQKVISEAEELPRTIVRRVVKEKLCNDGDDISVHKDALLAFSESARIFIHYLSATYLLFILFTFLLRVCLCWIVECEFAVPMTYVRNRRGRLSMLMMSSLLFKKLSFPTFSVLLKPIRRLYFSCIGFLPSSLLMFTLWDDNFLKRWLP